MELLALRCVLDHARIGLAEKRLVKRVAEAFACLGNFLFNLVVDFCKFLLYEHVGTIAFLGVAVVDQGIIECVNMT